MALQRYRIGSLIESVSLQWDGGADGISGINGRKQFIESPMPLACRRKEPSGYKAVPPGCFAVNFMHVGRDGAVPAALNDTDAVRGVSPAYFVFRIVRKDILMKEYLFMLLSLREFDRYAWFCTDSSIRSNLEWSRFLELELELPPVSIQRKYTAVYRAAQAKLGILDKGLEDLKAACGHIAEQLKKTCKSVRLGDYAALSLERCGERSHAGCKGITTQKEFIDTKADLTGISLKNYLWVRPRYFAYAPVTSRNGERISVALNTSDEGFPISSTYTVFYCKEEKVLLPEYLFLWFQRPDFDRYARYHSWGSSREVFGFSELSKLRLPLPEPDVQEGIADLLRCLRERTRLRNSMEEQIGRLCPVLIQGAMREGVMNRPE